MARIECPECGYRNSNNRKSCSRRKNRLEGVELTNDWDVQQSFQEFDLFGRDLSGLNLAKIDFRYANLLATDLSDTILEGANLRSIELTGASLEGVNLRGADLACAELEGACLKQADLSGAKLNGAHLNRVYRSEVEFINVDLSNASLVSADLTGANLNYEFNREGLLLVPSLRLLKQKCAPKYGN